MAGWGQPGFGDPPRLTPRRRERSVITETNDTAKLDRPNVQAKRLAVAGPLQPSVRLSASAHDPAPWMGRDGARAARRRDDGPDGSSGALARAARSRLSVRVPWTCLGDASRGLAARHRPWPGAHGALDRCTVGWPLPPVRGSPQRRVRSARRTARGSSGHAHCLRLSDPTRAA